MDIPQRAVRQLDHYQRLHSWLAFPLAVLKKFGEDRAGGLAALIAYYGFFSVFPLLLVFVTIMGFVLQGRPDLQASVVNSAKQQFPALAGYLRVGSISGSGIALVIGLLAALWGGLGVTKAAQDAMNSLWNVPVSSWPNVWRAPLRGLAVLATLGTTVIVSTAASGLRGIGGPLSGLFDVAGTLVPLLLNFALYLVAFQVLTVTRLTWREVLPGAALGAVLWTALQALGAYYTRHQVAHASQLYGTFAVVIGLLAWINLGALMTLYVAEANVVFVRRLWPRSLMGGDLTEADKRALGQEARAVDRLAALAQGDDESC